MLTSWIQGVSVLRNMCAHNSRIYNRTIHTTPEILDVDKVTPSPVHNGLYQILLAMKYLRSSDEEWAVFVDAFDKLIQNNIGVISLLAMNLPTDWKDAFKCINVVELHKIVKTDLTKHIMLKPVRLSARCYDKHLAIFILMKNIHNTE